MKLAIASLPLLVISVCAGYYKQPIDDFQTTSPVSYAKPAEETNKPASKGFFNFPSLDLETILTSGPIASIIAKTGVNITERFEEAKRKLAETGWDPRIDLITDENYRETIVEEPLSLEELEQRVWFLLISVPNGDPVSKFVDEKFEAAYNLSLSSPDKALPHVRWGRINYLDVTALTTRWWVWKVPMLVVLRRGGQELRFYSPQHIRVVPEVMHEFLRTDGWKETKPWSGVLAPGGRIEPLMAQIGEWGAKAYITANAIPKWLMLLVTGALGSLLINLMHKTPPTHPSAIRSASPTGGGAKHARIAPEAKDHDGATAIRHTRGMSPTKEGSPSPSKRQSARLQAKK